MITLGCDICGDTHTLDPKLQDNFIFAGRDYRIVDHLPSGWAYVDPSGNNGPRKLLCRECLNAINTAIHKAIADRTKK